MITSVTQWRSAVHFESRISWTGVASKRYRTPSTMIPRMWRITWSLLSHMVSLGTPVFTLCEMWSARGSQKPEGRPCAKQLSYGRSLMPIRGHWQVMPQYWIQQLLITTWKWRERQSKRNWTEWQRLVLATVPDRHFGSGSGSNLKRCQIGRPGRQ